MIQQFDKVAVRWLQERDQARSMLDVLAGALRDSLESATNAGRPVDPGLHAALTKYAISEGHAPTLLALGLVEATAPEGEKTLRKMKTIAEPTP